MIRVCTVVGARPQFIKAAVVSRAFREAPDRYAESIIHTGQHYDHGMSDVFFSELDIPKPDHNLGVGGGSHGQNTGRMLEKVEEVLVAERPDFVLLYGDTNSTLAGVLAAVKLHIPVAHVEAGLRSYNRRMPEEINRVLTDHASSLLFTPTDLATRNLAGEGISAGKVLQVGDVMYDAALFYAGLAERNSGSLARFGLAPKGYALATIHRPENTDDPMRLRGIFTGLEAAPMPVLLPLHPRTRKQIAAFDIAVPASVTIVDPVGYLDMVMLERNAALILTDSGGVQKEAYFHGVPCITMRDETEWVELVDAGVNIIVGADPDRIRAALARSITTVVPEGQLYGDGTAGTKIRDALQP
ncbi:MAG: UDP-N-acetylglucosamine 2-epimerase (non-hydrolyzing) [Xanthomonadaceae bacterium]|nr:UDP-N-acetylglucosamine 2-epimerase (non-hydrolyzing) [Xanthomonadaceae bacterium]